jgi:DNA-binding transcriptional MerR regulator
MVIMVAAKEARKFLTQGEVACRFRVSPSTIKNWRSRGLLRFFQAPGSSRVLYPLEAVEELERQSLQKEKEVVRLTGIKRERPQISDKPKKEWRI